METSEKKEQISSKVSAETKRKMEDQARKLGVTFSEYLRMKLEGQLDGDEVIAGAKTKEKGTNTENSGTEDSLGNTVILKVLSTKIGTTNELLEKLVESTSKTSEQANESIQELGAALLEQEERLTAAHAEALTKLEDKIKSESLVVKFDEAQRNLLSKLILFRKEKGKPNSDNVEEFLGWLLKEKIYGSWSGTPAGFDEEFKTAFPSLFAEQ